MADGTARLMRSTHPCEDGVLPNSASDSDTSSSQSSSAGSSFRRQQHGRKAAFSSTPVAEGRVSSAVVVTSSQRHTTTVPLWLGCAVLCTILVGIVGFSPFLAGQTNNNYIIDAARTTYNMVFVINGQIVYDKYLNEAYTVILGYYRAMTFQTKTMTAANFSDPMWDRDWQLFFTGVAALHPERYYYYMDLATGSFTGQYVRGADKLRIIGNVNDVNFTGYLPNKDPPFGYTMTDNVTLEFPPIFLFNNFFATGEAYHIYQTFMASDGQLVYGIATYIYSSLTIPADTIPVGAFYELIPISKMVDLSLSSATSATADTQSIILDYLGGLAAATVPQLADIYLPVGTPGAVCVTVEYNLRNISRCRHSVATMKPLWPLMFAAYDAVTKHPEGVVEGPISLTTYSSFTFEGNEYLVSAQFPLQTNGGWWTGAVTPIYPVYGAYISSRQRILIIISAVVAGLAVVVLLLTYILMVPLGALVEEMIAALKLQTQGDRYVKAAALATDVTAAGGMPSATALVCGSRHFQVSELGEVEVAIAQLHRLLADVAKMLPPPVISRIRATLAERSGGAAVDAGDVKTGSDVVSSEDQSDGDLSTASSCGSSINHTRRPMQLSRATAADNVAQMMQWVDSKYEINDAPATMPTLENSVDDRINVTAEYADEALPIEVVALESRAQRQLRMSHNNSAVALAQMEVASTAMGSILMNPTVSLRAARRRGYFMAVSLAELKCDPSQFASIIAPLTSAVWRHGGEVELIERCLLLATFGCYEAMDDAADRAVLCATEITDGHAAPRDDPHPASLRDSAIRLRCSVAIDCGWFESSPFLCVLPSGLAMRRQVVSSVARDVAVKLAPLAAVLNERLFLTADVLRFVDPETLRGRVPVVADHLKFDARTWSRMSRRGSVFVFVIPMVASGDGSNRALPAAQPFLAAELRKNDARSIAEGFQLMVNARYSEAEFHFKRSMEQSASKQRNRTLLRLLAVSSAIATAQRAVPGVLMAPYYRGECPLFETTIEEQVAYRHRQNEWRPLPNKFEPSDVGAEVLDQTTETTHRGFAGVSHRKKLKVARRQQQQLQRSSLKW
ncbi:transmembrane protein, putative [Bodo saltans]|uniref:Transmembrane protein, putative n=1 Tax=Bodo saltans TaxID=75058 RepID=A0A0S4ISA7_BODSA|nr:transmembrane protein, putative [Bodo saltans]|eukprot:CUF63471.1 transmembrane protein, putative [Bodo saltans]